MRNRIILVLVVIGIVAGAAFMLSRGDEPSPAPVAADSKPAPLPTEFELIRLSREGMGVIAGSATPGSFVDVMAEGRSIGRSRASAAGAWEVVIARPLQAGAHVLGLTATDALGQESRSADIAVVGVPAPPGKGPDLKTARGEKKPLRDDGVLAVMLPRQGERGGVVLQRPGQLKPVLALGLEIADFDAEGRTVLAGRANAGDAVNIYLDGRPVGTVKTGDDGKWTLVVPSVGGSPHNIRLEEIDPGNAVVLNVTQAFDPSVTLAGDLGGKSVLVWSDQSVWHVIRRQAGGALRYTQVFRPDQGLADEDRVKVPGVLKPGSDI